jgi:AmmeMemoRadiSam system protein B
MQPKLRKLSIEVEDDGYAVSDPYGLSQETLWLSAPAMFLASMLDGRRTLDDLQGLLRRDHGADVPLDQLVELVAILEKAQFLETPETLAQARAVEDAYLAQPARPMALGDRCYPAAREDFAAWASLFRGVAPPGPDLGPLRGLILPHLDPRRVPAVYGAALEALAQTPPPERVLIVGVAHSAIHEDASALPLGQVTPFGTLPVDKEALDALAARLPFPLYNAPLAFQDEHSIEFPMVFLKAVWPDAVFQVLPVVLRGNSDMGKLEAIAEALVALSQDFPFFPVASVDLSHVGARFDDPPLDREAGRRTQAIDRQYLDLLAAGQFDRAFVMVTAADNPTRIDAYASVQALKGVLEGPGHVLGYELSAELDSVSAVGAGAVAFPA